MNTDALKQTIAITATFTAEPIEESLAFWMQELELSCQIEFAPYNQVFQQLLAPTSLLSQNRKGINIILVRFEDWQRFENHEKVAEIESPENALEKISKNVQDLIVALKSTATRSSAPHIACLCPASPVAMADTNQMAFFQEMEAIMVSELAGVSGLYLMTAKDLAAYPVENYYDPQGDKLGHIPFTPVFFTALGTAIARKISAIKSAPYKVIVLDCDNTLWKGVVGEDGVMGIEIATPWKTLQEFIVEQQKAGVLICLCSKNSEADVVEVFEKRPEMPLKREHIVSWRLNWMPKPENIRSLATELNLGLDSFIFIDDNPVECAQVQASCPEVLTLQLPIDGDIPRFLNHVWAVDRLKVTEADKQRTSLYKQNIERDRFAKESLTFEDFLAGLALKVEISQPFPSQLPRVSQLTQRTNQFNFTTIRRSEGEIQQLSQSGLECRVVEVGDRFGDYGLVGVMIFSTGDDTIDIDTFLLSCRVLGRGVEHRMLTHLAEIAKERNLDFVKVFYIPTQRNLPALKFLESVGADFKQPLDNGYCFSLPVEFAAALSYTPSAAESTPDPNVPVKAAIATGAAMPQIGKSALMSRIANELYSAKQVLRLIESQQRQRPQIQQSFVAPRTETEQKLADIWKQVLRVKQVGIYDNFFELGGSSLLAVLIFAQIEKIFSKDLPVATLFEAPTVEQLSSILLRQKESTVSWSSSLVAIRPSGSKPPFFCVPGAGLDATSFAAFAQHLGPNQPFYSLKSEFLNGKKDHCARVEDMAAHYIKEIRSLQPKGPYLLGGNCFGGTVAFEMAQQLQTQGQKVALLALIDAYAPIPEPSTPPARYQAYLHNFYYWLFKAYYYLGNLTRQRGAKEKLAYALELAKFKLRQIAYNYKLYSSSGRSLPYDLRYYYAEEISQQAMSAYTPQVYQGKVTLLRTSRQNREWYYGPHLGWGELASEGVEIYKIPGIFGSSLREPSVQVLAERLRACLEDV
jgi:FkbH-like protein